VKRTRTRARKTAEPTAPEPGTSPTNPIFTAPE
jgi:hypothetical protein